MTLADLRHEYTRAGLSEADVDADPIRQFGVWFEQAWPRRFTNRTP